MFPRWPDNKRQTLDAKGRYSVGELRRGHGNREGEGDVSSDGLLAL